jgi:cytochrome oxidase assembly protein ShyY1
VERSTGDAIESGDTQTTIAHLDLGWFDEHVAADLYPVGIRLLAQDPPPVGELPVTLDAPELTEGPHLGYAVQWFLFSTVAIVGYPILLRRVAEQRVRGVGSAESDDGAGVPPRDNPPAAVVGSAHG